MLQHTEAELDRTGFAVGATITPEIASAVRALLDGKDALLQNIGAVEVEAHALLQAVAHRAYNIAEMDVPAPECAYSLEHLEDTVRALRMHSDILCWMKSHPYAGVEGGGVSLRPTEDQSAALNDEATIAGAIALATAQLGQAVERYNSLIAANRGGRPIMG